MGCRSWTGATMIRAMNKPDPFPSPSLRQLSRGSDVTRWVVATRYARQNPGAVGLTALRDRLVKRIGIKVAIIQYVLDQGPWDLAVGAFADLHCAGHQFWHVHDRHHPRLDPTLAREIGNPLKDVYIALDKGIGDLLQKMHPGIRLLVFSDLGMGPNYSGAFLLRDIVRRLHTHAHNGGPTAVEALRWLWRKTRSARFRGRASHFAVKQRHRP